MVQIAAGAVIYMQNWAAGRGGISMGSPAWPNPNLYEQTGWTSGSDPVDPVYPELRASEAIYVRNAIGPSGENALDFNEADRTEFETYRFAGVMLGGFGMLSNPEGAIDGWWDATTGSATIYYKPSQAAFDDQDPGSPTIIALTTGPTETSFTLDGGVRLRLKIDDDGEIEYLQLQANRGGIDLISYAGKTRAEILNLWQKFELRWKCGSNPGGGFSNVQSDGYLQVLWNDTLVYDVQNTPLSMNITPERPNWLSSVWIGFQGLLGPTTRLSVNGGTTGINTSQPCIETPTTNTGGQTGPILPPVNNWGGPVCAGGGDVPTSADLTDSESYY